MGVGLLLRVVWLPSSIFSSFCPLLAIHVQNPNSGQKIKFFRGRKQVEKKAQQIRGSRHSKCSNLQNVMESSWYQDFNNWSNVLWEKRDKRVDGWPLLNSFWPTFFLVVAYLFIVKVWGPRFMQNRPAYNLTKFLIIYNACQVLLSTYIFVQLLRAGWGGDYSFRCQPVDQSQSPKAQLMLHVCYVYYLSKFTEFIDTFCFVARKKFNQVSLLHVIHHGIMPMSVWPGARFLPGGHSSFFGLLNSFVHIVMYFYYMMAAF